MPKPALPGWKDKVLFTPGPLTTSRTVKQAMLRDLGSRDFEFIETIKDIRRRLVALVGTPDHYEAIPMQGSGTFALESVLSSTLPPNGRVVVLVNCAYGKLLVQMCAVLKIDHIALLPNTSPSLSANTMAITRFTTGINSRRNSQGFSPAILNST